MALFYQKATTVRIPLNRTCDGLRWNCPAAGLDVPTPDPLRWCSDAHSDYCGPVIPPTHTVTDRSNNVTVVARSIVLWQRHIIWLSSVKKWFFSDGTEQLQVAKSWPLIIAPTKSENNSEWWASPHDRKVIISISPSVVHPYKPLIALDPDSSLPMPMRAKQMVQSQGNHLGFQWMARFALKGEFVKSNSQCSIASKRIWFSVWLPGLSGFAQPKQWVGGWNNAALNANEQLQIA